MGIAELRKWNYDRASGVCTSKERITVDDVDDILEELTKLDIYSCIRVWSGVHGEPGGLVSVGEPDFSEQDLDFAQPGRGNPRDPQITIHRMLPMMQSAPQMMRIHRSLPNTAVVLAWCYSEGFRVPDERTRTAITPFLD